MYSVRHCNKRRRSTRELERALISVYRYPKSNNKGGVSVYSLVRLAPCTVRVYRTKAGGTEGYIELEVVGPENKKIYFRAMSVCVRGRWTCLFDIYIFYTPTELPDIHIYLDIPVYSARIPLCNRSVSNHST